MTRPIPAWMIGVRRRAIAGAHGKVTYDDVVNGWRGRDTVRVRENICFEIIGRGGSVLDAAWVAGYRRNDTGGYAKQAADRCWNRIRETRDQEQARSTA